MCVGREESGLVRRRVIKVGKIEGRSDGMDRMFGRGWCVERRSGGVPKLDVNLSHMALATRLASNLASTDQRPSTLIQHPSSDLISS